MQWNTRRLGSAVAALLLSLPVLGAAAPTRAAEPVGYVATLSGAATAAGPTGRRALACGDAVYPGETLSTADASHVGLLMGDALAHVDAASTLRVEADGGLRLEDGKLRVLDAVEGEDARAVAALEATATHRGNDTEAYIFSEKTGRYSMLCEWDAPLPVARGDETHVAPPGECVIAKRDEPLYPADAHDERIGPIDEGPCDGEIPFGPVADRFPPYDVGAGPPLPFAFELPQGPSAPTPDPCDQPGSGCFGIDTAAGGPPIPPAGDPPSGPPAPPPIVEPPPVDGGIPGT